jgi:hypothetical protein
VYYGEVHYQSELDEEARERLQCGEIPGEVAREREICESERCTRKETYDV